MPILCQTRYREPDVRVYVETSGKCYQVKVLPAVLKVRKRVIQKWPELNAHDVSEHETILTHNNECFLVF